LPRPEFWFLVQREKMTNNKHIPNRLQLKTNDQMMAHDDGDREMQNENYIPNKLLPDRTDRMIAEPANLIPGYEFWLRAIRRHIFMRGTWAPDSAKHEFFKPCLGILIREDDKDGKPCLVLESESLGEEMEKLYEKHGVLWAIVEQKNNQCVLTCRHAGTSMVISDSMWNVKKLLIAALSWHEKGIASSQGYYIHSHCEHVLRMALLTLGCHIRCHHQVPLSHVLGLKKGLLDAEKSLLWKEIDCVVTLRLDPEATVILPIKADIHNSHRNDPEKMERDKRVRALCDRFSVPLLTIGCGDSEHSYVFKCRRLFPEPVLCQGLDVGSWAKALDPFLRSGLEYARPYTDVA